MAVDSETPVSIDRTAFDKWLKEFKQEALSKGIRGTTANAALGGIRPINRIIELDRKQPERRLSFREYLKNVTPSTRVRKGKKLMQENQALLRKIGKEYGVQPRFIVALWGIETDFGGYTGNFYVPEALATLAYDKRRSAFFRKELHNALQVLDEGHVSIRNMKGSWAGAMGQTQFMPSSFLAFSQDYDDDGRRDIWQSRPDIFASIANYLAHNPMQLVRQLPRRNFWAIVVSLAGITLLSWAYLVSMAGGMAMPKGMAAMQMQAWDFRYFLMMFLMWAVMMIGMMLPSVTPTVLIYAAVARKSAVQGTPVAPTGAFVSGYIAMWIGFSLLATLMQWSLEKAALLSPMMVSRSASLGAALLIAAGIYQWLPLKDKCLHQCRSPVDFISSNWRSGTIGAFRMGLSHGTFCLGCCWVLMGLLFVGGVMNLLWIAAITLFVLLEKLLPLGDKGGRVMGLLMIASGMGIAFMGT